MITKEPTLEQMRSLWEHCVRFVEEEHVQKEGIYQQDNIILNAYEFIGGVCDVVGEYEYPDEE